MEVYLPKRCVHSNSDVVVKYAKFCFEIFYLFELKKCSVMQNVTEKFKFYRFYKSSSFCYHWH